jgi:acetylornithine deacetylase
MSETLELLRQLVSIPSVSGQEADLAETVTQLATAEGFTVERLGNNLWFELGSGGQRLLLNSHLDTVPPCAGWSSDPWAPRVQSGRLTGLGANDAKGCVVAILAAAALLRRAGLPRHGTLVVALTAEEETGGPGGISAVLPRLGPLAAAVFGEPTGLAPCTGQRGMLLLKCTAHGESGHVAHAAALGLPNAIHGAARNITKLAEMQFPPYTAFDSRTHATQAQVTLVNGGITANQVPDRCEFRVDLRTTPNLDHEELLARIRSELDCEVECLSQRYRPVATEHSERIVKAALSATGQLLRFSGTVSDWSLVPGIPAVKLGPGDSARSHQPDEYLLQSELEAGVECYVRLVRSYFGEAGHD